MSTKKEGRKYNDVWHVVSMGLFVKIAVTARRRYLQYNITNIRSVPSSTTTS